MYQVTKELTLHFAKKMHLLVLYSIQTDFMLYRVQTVKWVLCCQVEQKTIFISRCVGGWTVHYRILQFALIPKHKNHERDEIFRLWKHNNDYKRSVKLQIYLEMNPARRNCCRFERY